MKRIFQICCLFLLVYQTFAVVPHSALPPVDDVKTINILDQLRRASLTIRFNAYPGNSYVELPWLECRFYLLDENIINILQKANFKPEFEDGKKKYKITGKDYLEAAARSIASAEENEESQMINLLIEDVIAKHEIKKIQTNYYGMEKVKDLKIGKYYLFGLIKLNNELMVWNQPVVIVTKANIIEVSRRNAAGVFEVE